MAGVIETIFKKRGNIKITKRLTYINKHKLRDVLKKVKRKFAEFISKKKANN